MSGSPNFLQPPSAASGNRLPVGWGNPTIRPKWNALAPAPRHPCWRQGRQAAVRHANAKAVADHGVHDYNHDYNIVTAPRILAALAHPPSHPRSLEVNTRRGWRAMVLMAEDDDAIRPGMSQCLPQRGWHVVEAGHAAAAIEVVESGNLIDLVFYPDARHDGRRGSRAGCARATRRSCSPRAGA
jgi:hypothetical protein